MLIGEVVKESGLTRDTIRYYEQRGLIEEPIRRENNYKDYGQDTVRRLAFIKDMQGVGFTLRETGEFLQLFDDGNATCANTGPMFSSRMTRIDEKIAQLKRMRSTLRNTFEACAGNSQNDACNPVVDSLKGV